MSDLITEDKRKELAKNGQAMPDGGFPIRNISDLKNAIQSFGRASNKLEVKAWIKKRAKELNAENLIPDSWKEAVHSDDFIAHHGVKGMKWGVRHDTTKSSAKKANKKASKAKASEARTASKNRKILTDEELDRRITRLEKERRLKTLTDSEVSPGKTYANDILANSGKMVVSGIVGAVAAGLGKVVWDAAKSKVA